MKKKSEMMDSHYFQRRRYRQVEELRKQNFRDQLHLFEDLYSLRTGMQARHRQEFKMVEQQQQRIFQELKNLRKNTTGNLVDYVPNEETAKEDKKTTDNQIEELPLIPRLPTLQQWVSRSQETELKKPRQSLVAIALSKRVRDTPFNRKFPSLESPFYRLEQQRAPPKIEKEQQKLEKYLKTFKDTFPTGFDVELPFLFDVPNDVRDIQCVQSAPGAIEGNHSQDDLILSQSERKKLENIDSNQTDEESGEKSANVDNIPLIVAKKKLKKCKKASKANDDEKENEQNGTFSKEKASRVKQKPHTIVQESYLPPIHEDSRLTSDKSTLLENGPAIAQDPQNNKMSQLDLTSERGIDNKPVYKQKKRVQIVDPRQHISQFKSSGKNVPRTGTEKDSESTKKLAKNLSGKQKEMNKLENHDEEQETNEEAEVEAIRDETDSVVAETKQKKKKKKKDSDDDLNMLYDPSTHNPDGSLRTMFDLPDFQHSLNEALKARYLRLKFKPWYEKELTLTDVFPHLKKKSKLQQNKTKV